MSTTFLLLVAAATIMLHISGVASELEVCLNQCYASNKLQTTQGKPGKMGPPGPIGPPGPKGSPGECICDEKKLLSDLSPKAMEHMRVQGCGVGIREGGGIYDEALTSSSEHNTKTKPANGRLNRFTGYDGSYGGWRMAIPYKEGEWVQVNLRAYLNIIGVVTQGDHDSNNFYVKSFKMKYGNSETSLKDVLQNGKPRIFDGNRDGNSYKINIFDEPIKSKYFRIYPVTWSVTPTIRFELLLC